MTRYVLENTDEMEPYDEGEWVKYQDVLDLLDKCEGDIDFFRFQFTGGLKSNG